jgi:hypothetical protein
MCQTSRFVDEHVFFIGRRKGTGLPFSELECISDWTRPSFNLTLELSNYTANYKPVLRTAMMKLLLLFIYILTCYAQNGNPTFRSTYSFGENIGGEGGTAFGGGFVPGVSDIVKVAVGASTSMAITSTGLVYGWGDNHVKNRVYSLS